MAEKDWFRDIIAAEKRSARKAPSMARAFGDYQAQCQECQECQERLEALVPNMLEKQI